MVVLLLVLTACATKHTPSNNSQTNQPAAANQPTQSSTPATPLSALQEGEASGTIVDEGQTITLKYAYAGHGEQFDEPAVVILLTETPIAPDVLAKAFEELTKGPSKGFFGIFPRDNKGLEYQVGKGFWVQYNPSGFQTSGSNTLKDYSVENGVVRGRDEDSTDFFGKGYKRSVSFVARLPEKK
jgi:hypothetical protein